MTSNTVNLPTKNFNPLLVLLISIFITFLIWYVVNDYVNQRLEDRFELQVDEIKLALTERMLNYDQVLRGTQGLFIASVEVNRDEWHRYVISQKTNERFPGIQALAYTEIIGTKNNLSEHIEKIRSEGFPDYTIHPIGERDLYHSIIYIEPMVGINQKAFGLDISFEKNRYDAMQRARDTGQSTLTHKITLVQETGEDIQAGFLMILPVYNNDLPQDTLSERQESIQGYVSAAFRMNDLMEGVLGSGHHDVSYQIFDQEISDQNLMYSSNFENSNLLNRHHQKISTITFGDKIWVVDFFHTSGLVRDVEFFMPIIILLFGFTMSGILFFIFNSFNSSRIRVEKLTIAIEQFSGDMGGYVEPSLKSSKHEIANLARAFEKMRDNIRFKNKLLKKNVRELQEINILKEEFTAMISHEIKTPLTPIIGWCDVLMDKDVSGPLNDIQKDAVNTIRLNSLKLLSLISDMLDTHILEMGKMTFEKNSFKILELFTDLQKNYKNIIEGKIQIIFSASDSLLITSDRKRIEQVLTNLINNSIEFISKDNGLVEISAEDDDRSVVFSVKDNGKGIPKEYLELIFKKFYQTDTSERREHGGTGLGLTISMGIVNGLGGDIWVENRVENGSIFYFRIPKGDLD